MHPFAGKRGRRCLLAIATVAALVSPALVVDASPAAADPKQPHVKVTPNVCDPDTYYEFSGNTAGWIATWGSKFLAGPGSLSYTSTYTGTASATITGTLTGSISIIVVSLGASTGLSLTASLSKSVSENYVLDVASGHTARAVIGHRGYRDTTNEYRYLSPCAYTKVGTGSTYAPVSSSSDSTYCIHQDDYPASTWETASGGCTNQT